MRIVTLVLIGMMLFGCVQKEPLDFELGREVAPPYGCIEYRHRGGKC